MRAPAGRLFVGCRSPTPPRFVGCGHPPQNVHGYDPSLAQCGDQGRCFWKTGGYRVRGGSQGLLSASCLGAKHRSASLMLIHRVQLREERRRLHIYIFGCNLRVQESEHFWAVSPGTIGNRTSSKVESFWLVSIETTGNRSSCNKSSHFGGVSVRDHLKDGIYCCHTCRSHQSPILFQYLQRWDATLSTGPCGPAKILRFQVPKSSNP